MDISSIISSSGYSLHGPGQVPESSSKPSIEEMAQRLIEAKDKDDSGTLGAAELCISKELFNRIDANGNGQLSAEELVAAAHEARKAMGPPPGMPMMKDLGSDEDDKEEQTILDILSQDDEETTQTRIDLML